MKSFGQLASGRHGERVSLKRGSVECSIGSKDGVGSSLHGSRAF